MRMPSERALPLLKSQEVSLFQFESMLGICLSISPRNYEFKCLQFPTRKCYKRFEFGNIRVHERYVAYSALLLNDVSAEFNPIAHTAADRIMIERDENQLESGNGVTRRLHEKDAQIEELRNLNEKLRSLNAQLKDELHAADMRIDEMERLIENLKDDLILGTKTVHR